LRGLGRLVVVVAAAVGRRVLTPPVRASARIRHAFSPALRMTFSATCASATSRDAPRTCALSHGEQGACKRQTAHTGLLVRSSLFLLPPACWCCCELCRQPKCSTQTPPTFGRLQFSSPLLLRASQTRVDTERLAERETLLHRLGSKLNRTVLNSCANSLSLSVAQKHVTFPQPGFFANRDIFTKLTIFGNTKQVIQDYDTVFDNSIPFRKNDLQRITYFRITGVPGLHFVPWHRGSGSTGLGAAAPVTGAAADEYNLNVVDCNASVTRRSSISVSGVWGTPSRRRQT